MMMRLALASFFLACMLMLQGCNLIYRMDIPQGNIVQQEQVDQLQPGMTRRQVSLVMGTPAIADPFHQNRWDYVYSLRRNGGREVETKRFTLYFENNVLVRTEGDFEPAESS